MGTIIFASILQRAAPLVAGMLPRAARRGADLEPGLNLLQRILQCPVTGIGFAPSRSYLREGKALRFDGRVVP